jgi:hypothetical protein
MHKCVSVCTRIHTPTHTYAHKHGPLTYADQNLPVPCVCCACAYSRPLMTSYSCLSRTRPPCSSELLALSLSQTVLGKRGKQERGGPRSNSSAENEGQTYGNAVFGERGDTVVAPRMHGSTSSSMCKNSTTQPLNHQLTNRWRPHTRSFPPPGPPTPTPGPPHPHPQAPRPSTKGPPTPTPRRPAPAPGAPPPSLT